MLSIARQAGARDVAHPVFIATDGRTERRRAGVAERTGVHGVLKARFGFGSSCEPVWPSGKALGW